MKRAVASEQVTDSGLRYLAKVAGSPFPGSRPTRSCFKCGTHRPLDQLRWIRVLGRNEACCAGGCGTPRPASLPTAR